jgi:hypothetical protein
MEAIYETDTDSTSYEESTVKSKDFYKGQKPNYVKKLIEKCEELTFDVSKPDTTNTAFCCKLCNTKNTNENYMILSCNHIFHIRCLAESNFKDIYQYPIIDQEYFSHRKCLVCSEQLQQEELLYLHGKFLTNTKGLIKKHQSSIDNLEAQLKRIKDELRTCYEYKHRLEQQREKSKQIVSILTTTM